MATVGAAVLVTYLGGLGNAFQYDDIHSIVDNPHIRTLDQWPAFFWRPQYFSAEIGGAMFRPLVVLSYALQHAVHGYWVEGFRLFNVVLHAANALLVLALLGQVGVRRRVALVGACLFAVHPVHAETVNYISSRSESMAAFFALLACWAALRGRLGQYAALLAYGFGLLCKSAVIGLPVVLAVYRWTGNTTAPPARTLAWMVGIGVAYLAGVQAHIAKALVAEPVRQLPVQWATQAKALVYYLKLLVFPWGLSVDHGFVPSSPWTVAVVLAAVFVAGLGVVVRLGYGRQGLLGLVWIAVFLGPTLIVPLNVLVNEHRLYLASVAFCLFMAQVLEPVARGKLVWALVGLLALTAYERSNDWRTPALLWGDALQRSAYMPRPYLYMAAELKREGRHEEAIAHYRRALTVNPTALTGIDARTAYNNIGATYLSMGQSEQAIEAYRKCLAIDPDYQKARDSLEALLALRHERWDPGAEGAHKRGLLYLVEGRLIEAETAFKKALALQLRPEIYMSLALVYERLDNVPEAVRVYQILSRAGATYAATAAKKIVALQKRAQRR
jgi:protein O-mannosyl-transferase